MSFSLLRALYLYASKEGLEHKVNEMIFRLPPEHGQQLQEIARAEGKPIVDVVADLIRAKIEVGVIPADLPGITVTKSGQKVEITMPDFGAEVSATEAARLADMLRDASAPLTPADIERKQRLIEGAAALAGIKVKRMGRGVKLVSPISGKEYPLAFGVANDLAGQIERELQEA